MITQIKKGKLLCYHRVVVVSIVIYLVGVCGCQPKSYDREVRIYADYSFYKQEGIKELSQEEVSEYKKTKMPYVELLYKNNVIDSIALLNLTTIPYLIKPIISKDASLYEINIIDDIYGNRKSFLLFKKIEIEHYTFITPVVYVDSTMSCQIIKMTNDTSIRINCRIKQSDTVDFSNKLIAGEYINIYQRLDTADIKKQLTKKLTLVDYFRR